jgi:endo-1,4-beta-xylanase
VTDPVLRNQDGRPAHNDGVELYVDRDNGKTLTYEADDLFVRVIRAGSVTAERGTLPEGFSVTQREVAGGYRVDFTVPLDAAAAPGICIGIDVHVIDNDNDRREHKIAWAAQDDEAYRSPASLGTVCLAR